MKERYMAEFPEKFIWGAATSSYQIEGAAHEDGRGLSIWDTFCAIPGKVYAGQNGDIAADHYHRYEEDVGLMRDIGIRSYRFSIAWPRIFPTGKNTINWKGVDFYNRLIDKLLEYDIAPMVTLYHWDLPQALQDLGGWTNRDTISRFVDYADYVFRAFGDRVKLWITHNEPWVVAYAGHYIGRHAPGMTNLSKAVQVSHHLILSHAKAVERYREIWPTSQAGKIGPALNLYPMYPATESWEDKKAAELADEFHNRWFLDSILAGKYPEKLFGIFKEKLGVPEINDGDMETIAANRSNFLGVNFYFRKVIAAADNHDILCYKEVKPSGSKYTSMDWEIFPEGLHRMLMDIKERYDNPHVYITENGAAFDDVPQADGSIHDHDRIDYLAKHVEQLAKCIQEGVNLDGYYIWSLMDNFEWAFGFSKRFGIVYIDYGTLERKMKSSAWWYRDLIKNNGCAIPSRNHP